MNNIVLLILLALLAVYLVRMVTSRLVWDKLLGMNLVSVKIIAIIIVFASVNNASYLLDYAIIYAITGFIGTIFIAIFLSKHKRKKGGKG